MTPLSHERTEELQVQFESLMRRIMTWDEGRFDYDSVRQRYRDAFIQWHFTGYLSHAEQIEAQLVALRSVAEAAKNMIHEFGDDGPLNWNPVIRVRRAVDALTALEGWKDA